MHYTDEDIDRFLYGTMDEKSKTDFLSTLQSDPDLRRKVEEMKLLNDALKVIGRRNVRAEMQRLNEEHGKLAPPKLSYFDKIKFGFIGVHSFIKVGILFILLAIIVLWGVKLIFPCPDKNYVQVYFQDPVLLHDIAGDNVVDLAKKK